MSACLKNRQPAKDGVQNAFSEASPSRTRATQCAARIAPIQDVEENSDYSAADEPIRSLRCLVSSMDTQKFLDEPIFLAGKSTRSSAEGRPRKLHGSSLKCCLRTGHGSGLRWASRCSKSRANASRSSRTLAPRWACCPADNGNNLAVVLRYLSSL